MSRQEPLETLLDREITLSEDDSFGHRHYAEVLREVVEAPGHEPPFSIGLLGDWGAGKSSIQALYTKSLEDDLTGNPGARRRDRIRAITFNAWRFGGENIKRALLRHVFLALGGDEGEIDDHLFRSIEERTPTRKPWREIIGEVVGLYGALLLAGALVAALIALLAAVALSAFAGGGATEQAFVAVAGIAVFGYVFKLLIESGGLQPATHRHLTRIDAPQATAEQYESHFVKQLKKFKRGKAGSALGGSGRAAERLVIFVDDLDRLSPEEMVEGLEAVRTFMEIPRTSLPKGLGMVFVISCDEDRVADALWRRRRAPELPGTVFNRTDARRFLDRIFQFRIEVARPPKQDMREFALSQLRTKMPGMAGELAKTNVNVRLIIERLIHVGVTNPRNALQNLNAFSQAWWLARVREREGAGTEALGGLSEGAVLQHPIALAAVSAIRVDFPDFFQDLERHPDLINAAQRVFLQSESIEKQPEKVRGILSGYLTDEGVVKPEHRPLRRYLASLEGLRWPASLRPLVSLSEDAITRKFGDRASLVFDALVSGDTAGVEEALGLDARASDLDDVSIQLLRGMVIEELAGEESARVDNAFAVIARLMDRLPEAQAHTLTEPLAGQVASSENLRSRLGLTRMIGLLDSVGSENRRALGGVLMSDLIPRDGPVRLKLPSGQTPSMGEAIVWVEQAVPVFLHLARQGDLAQDDLRMLTHWLPGRTVSLNGEEGSVPFSTLERWFQEFETLLLAHWGLGYIEQLSDALSKSRPSTGPGELARRVRSVLECTRQEGEVSRRRAWTAMSDLVMTEPEEVSESTWQFAQEHPADPQREEFIGYVRALMSRMRKVSRTQLKVGGPGLSLVNLPGASWQPARGHRGAP